MFFSIKLQDGTEWDALQIFFAFIVCFGGIILIVQVALQIKTIKYVNSALCVEYVFMKKRSHAIRLEEIASAKLKDKKWLDVKFRKNTSMKSLTMKNEPKNGIDKLVEDLKRKGFDGI